MSKLDYKPEEQLLSWETDVLRSIAQGKPLSEILHQIAMGVEKIIADSLASILLLDKDHERLLHGAAPSLSKHYIDLINGSQIGPQAGSCGTAAFTKQTVIVSDIESDPLWAGYREIAAAENLKACWSTPIINHQGDVIATFALYYRTKRRPQKDDLRTIDRMAQIVGIAIEHDKKEQVLRYSELQIKEAFHGAAIGIAVADMQGNFLQVNPAYSNMLGYTENELLGLDFPSLTHPEDLNKNLAVVEDLKKGKRQSAIFEKRYLSKTGRVVWARLSVSIQKDPYGNPARLIAIAEDVSSKKDAELLIEETERSMANLMSNLPGMVYRCRNDPNWTMLYVSDAAKTITGYDPLDIINNRNVSFVQLIVPEDVRYVDLEIQSAIKLKSPFQLEYRIQRSDGVIVWLWEQGRAICDESGSVAFLEGYITDITLQKAAELALAQTQSKASAVLKSVGEGIYGVDVNGNTTFVNNAALKAFAYSESEMIGKPSHPMVHHHYPDGREYPIENCPVCLTLSDGLIRQVSNEVFFKKDGSSFPVEYMLSPIKTDDGIITGVVISFNDISERLALEEQLRQVQRLESLGQLTGGVAHDFNNLLTVILGNAESLDEHLASNPKLQALATMITDAAQRGAELTKGLLAFARKQPLNPQEADIKNLLLSIRSLLQRALGEHIEIHIECQSSLWPVLIDPVQMESALLNLAINARDAMPDGGRLIIEASNTELDSDYASQHEATSGEYVMIVISDTGCGIPHEYISRVFEPFFTTKQKAKGTGLGLAMVYGFIKQSGGHINIYSEPHHGTTVRMYLPRLVGLVESKAVVPAPPEVLTGTEIILLVEDDTLVRSYAYDLLTTLGYQVIQAENGPEALKIIKSTAEIDLLFTDVVMPGGMNGKQLADQALTIRPGLKVLFTSGYSESAIVHHGRLDPGIQLLSKPYRRAELARKIRIVLDENR